MIVCIPLSPADEEEEEEEEVHNKEEEEEGQSTGGGEEAIEAKPNKRRRKEYYTITFIDSFQFLPSSLAKLVDSLPDTPLSRRMLTKTYNMSMENAQRISKATFPYSFFTSFDVLQSTTALPPISAFYNDLTECECSTEAYTTAQEAWDTIGYRTLEDYLIYYLKG